MTGYVLRRLAQALIVLAFAVTAVFLLARLSGNPAVLLAPPNASAEDVQAISRSLGLEDPLPTQYVRFVSRVVLGDFGDSFLFRLPVRDLIAQALPRTALLAFAAFAFAAVLGVSAGTFAALQSGTWLDTASRGLAVLGQSVPSFWLGMILILVFAADWKILPAFGYGTPAHLILPAIALGAAPLAATTRLARSATVEVLRAEHTLFTRSKGVSQTRYLSHVLRNAALPLVTLSGVQLGFLLGGSVVVETLFAWPGMGLLAIQALNSRDYNVVQGVVLVNTAIFVVLNLAVDLSYGALDPRVRRQ